MPRSIEREELHRLISGGAQLVEVLPREEFEEDHLPGAISLPLRHLDEARETLDASRPIVVYCWDSA